jgi:putative flippase GtrA
MAVRFAGVGLLGFAVDALLLRLGLQIGLTAAAARLVSLFCAMQLTFAVNGTLVFRCLTVRKLAGQWAGYMVANGFGNLCNYWIFLTLVSSHWPVIASPYVALVVGSIAAYLINYAGTRLLVFGKGRRALIKQGEQSVCGPPDPKASPSADDVTGLDLDAGRLAGGGLAGPGAVETAGG